MDEAVGRAFRAAAQKLRDAAGVLSARASGRMGLPDSYELMEALKVWLDEDEDLNE